MIDFFYNGMYSEKCLSGSKEKCAFDFTSDYTGKVKWRVLY